MIHQYANLADTVYIWFGTNLTSGTGGDGASAAFDVREGGTAAGAAPVLSGSPTLLSHANYPDGCYEIAVDATTGNGFAAGKSYAVFCTLLIDSQNPSGFVGSFRLAGVPAEPAVPVDPNSTKPTWGDSFGKWFSYLIAKKINKKTVTAGEEKTRNTADDADLDSHALSDDGTTFTKGAAS